MKIYIVNYDLNSPGRSYELLEDRILSYDAFKILDSTWAICTTDTAEEVLNEVSLSLDNNDNIIVTTWTVDSCWHLSDEANTWISDRMDAL